MKHLRLFENHEYYWEINSSDVHLQDLLDGVVRFPTYSKEKLKELGFESVILRRGWGNDGTFERMVLKLSTNRHIKRIVDGNKSSLRVYSLEDDYYMVDYNDEFRESSTWYKCDQLEGLLKLLMDKFNIPVGN